MKFRGRASLIVDLTTEEAHGSDWRPDVSERRDGRS